MVIIKDDNVPRNHWSLAIIDEVFPSSDGRIRNVKLSIANGKLDKKGRPTKGTSHLEWPVHKLVLLVEASKEDQGILPLKAVSTFIQ